MPPAISPILGGYVLLSPLQTTLSFTLISVSYSTTVSFPGGPTVSAHSRLSCYTLGPTVASTVTQNNLARPRLRSRTQHNNHHHHLWISQFRLLLLLTAAILSLKIAQLFSLAGQLFILVCFTACSCQQHQLSRRVHECALYSFSFSSRKPS